MDATVRLPKLCLPLGSSPIKETDKTASYSVSHLTGQAQGRATCDCSSWLHEPGFFRGHGTQQACGTVTPLCRTLEKCPAYSPSTSRPTSAMSRRACLKDGLRKHAFGRKATRTKHSNKQNVTPAATIIDLIALGFPFVGHGGSSVAPVYEP